MSKYVTSRRISLLNFIIVIAAAIFLVACSKSDDNDTSKQQKSISIAVSTSPLSAPFFVAEIKGYFSEQGLDAKVIDTIGGNRCLNAVLEGKADFGTSSDYPVMMKSFNRNDYAIAATFVSSENDVKLITKRSSGINSPSDLKGKRIGTITGTSSHYFLDRFLLFNGMTLDDVTVVHLSPEKMTAALKNSEVDALSSWEPYGYLAKEALGNDSKIFPAKNYYRETFNLVSKKSYLDENPETTKKLLHALKQAITFIQNNPKEAQSILVSRLKLDDDFIGWIWKDFNFKLTLEQSLIITLENEARWATENNIVKSKTIPNFLDFFDFYAMEKTEQSAITIHH